MDSLTNTVELVMMKDGEVSQQCSLPAMPGARRGHIIEASVVTNSCRLYIFGIFRIFRYINVITELSISGLGKCNEY